MGFVAVPQDTGATEDKKVFGVSFFVSAFVHFALIFVLVTLARSSASSDFFSQREAPEAGANLTVVNLASAPTGPKGATPGGSPGRPKAPRAIRTTPTAPPSPARPAPRTVSAPARTASRITDVPAPSIAGNSQASASNPRGPSAAGPLGGDPNGQGGGGGVGTGTGSGNGPGDGGGGGKGGGGGGDPGQRVFCLIEYEGFHKNGLFETVRPLVAPVTSWQDVCSLYGLNYQELVTRPYVEPLCFHPYVPPLQPGDNINKEGVVGLQAVVHANGNAEISISEPAGDAVLDRVGYGFARYMEWVPALRYGQPVDATVHLRVRFRPGKSYDPNDPNVPR